MKIFPKFPKRVDPLINTLTSIQAIRYIPVIILFNNFKDKSTERKLLRGGFKTKWELPFINGICGFILTRNLENLQKLIEIKKIYYDGKAKLMGWITVGTDKNYISANSIKSSLLSGKNVSIAFIDSGIYPHKAFDYPRKKIAAFRDFVNKFDYPYDDSGHGTACMGAACGFSPDNDFTAPAFNSSIICAKSFDMANYGQYSDILAAMQWILDIKEKYNIKITVMPFGIENPNKNFDIISVGVEAMWEKGILVISSAGNLGPHAGTITSPGNSPKVLTLGAFEMKNDKPMVLPFSSRGPCAGNIAKPDMVMPGCSVPSIGNMSKSLRADYINFSGTSAAVSLGASAAALLYEKKENISPDDAKSILKLCCISLGEIKITQGDGFINIKKIEEI